MLDSGNELRVGDVLIRAIARMANEPAFLAKARAEIGVKVARFFLSGCLVGYQQNVVVVVLNVPVINQGHQHLQPLKFIGADKRIL